MKRLERKFGTWILFHFFEFIWFYLGALACLYALHYFQVQLPKLAKDLGDNIINDQLDSSAISSFIFLALAIFFFRTCSRYLFFLPARVQQKNLRIEIIEKIQKSVPKNYQKYSPGQIYQILFNDFNRLRGFIGFALLQVGNIIIASYILIPEINKIDSKIFIAFTPVVLAVFIFSIVIFTFQPFLRKGIDIQGDVQNTIIETFDAKDSISSFQKQESFLSVFNRISHKELNYFFIASIGPAVARPLIPTGVSLSLLWGAVLIQKLGLGVTYLIMYSGFLFLVLEPLMFLAWIGIIIAGALSSWGRIKEFISDMAKQAKPLGDYDSSKEEFDLPFWDNQILIKLKNEEIIGLCGKTGSGKSTLIEMVAQHLKYSKKKVSYVKQEPHLFNDSVENNILLGKECTPEMKKKIDHLLQIMGFDQLGNDFDAIMKTEVGENGKKLSGGQIKRLSLIRSLVSDCDYLLWDDPFSSVDNILEASILRELKQQDFFRNRCILLTSHRLTTFSYVSEVYFLEEGGEYEFEEIVETIKNEKINEFFKFQMALLS